MTARRITMSLFIILLQMRTLIVRAFSPPSINDFPSNSNNSSILQDVLKAISVREKWDLEDVRISELDFSKVRFGISQSYEFRIGFGKSSLLLKFSDQVVSWKKFKKPKSNIESLINQVSSFAVLDTLKLEGPFELRVDTHHKLSLSLPMNTSHAGLKHILVGEGITLEVRRAQEVSLFHSSDLGLGLNMSSMFSNGKRDFWPFQQSVCLPLLPIRILGSASLVAYRTRNPDSHIETIFISEDTIELLPEKCYSSHINKKQTCSIDSLSLRISTLEKILKSLLGDRIRQWLFGFVKANIKASATIRFQLQLERDIRSNITLRGILAEWRTRPSIERLWFEIFARVETERLKPLLIKKVKPFMVSDSVSWSNLMSNISFTKLRSVLVPPEPLTLDVKW
ncbi:Tunicamycin induced 1 [Quillaja saponaria]|uniref:Tunicamycin induced 1 n=1 Tax=Quillaja saponaria TaxID=32244 RepID=A0AAD7PJP8_QUISA|nr:Tunicamycin induced 1 [Quillaja saponaria]